METQGQFRSCTSNIPNNPFTWLCDTERYSVSLKAHKVGHDLCCILTGGDAHIGASAFAHPSMEHPDEVQLSVVPGHREGEIAREIAFRLAHAFQCTVQLCAGIHYDNIDAAAIERITAICFRICRNLCEKYGCTGAERETGDTPVEHVRKVRERKTSRKKL